MKTRFILQKQKNDCVVAAVATVAHKSYAEVRKVLGPPGRGLENHEILWLINHWGDWRLKVPRRAWALQEWADKHPLCVVCVGWVFERDGHALAIVDGVVFDPSGGTPDLTRHVTSSVVPA